MRLSRYGRYGDGLTIPGTNIQVALPGVTGPMPQQVTEPLLQPLNLLMLAAGAGLLVMGKAIGKVVLISAALDMVARQVSPEYRAMRSGVPQVQPSQGLSVNIPGISMPQTMSGWSRR